MNTMAKVAAQENEAVKRNWQGEARRELPFVMDHVTRENREVMGEIVDAAARESGISRADILGKSSVRDIARVRQYAMWKASQAGISSKQVGRFFGRDHTTVLHAVSRIEGLLGQ